MSIYGKTIAAVSTPPGKGGVSLIRMSGEDAIKTAERVFRPVCNSPLSSLEERRQYYGKIISDGSCIDDGMATVFRAPRSYTGEDTVEISCHGGVLVTRTVLEALFAAGAYPAEAGEFTRRAVLNGKLTLTEAEAVGDLLEAKSYGQIKLSSTDSRAGLRLALSHLTDSLSALIASICARIDFPEEDLGDLTDEETADGIRNIISETDRLISTYRCGRAVGEGITTAICGKPNAGKSSVYNLLCGTEAAIVTEYAGTTRDLLESDVSVGDILLRLTDTAGIRTTSDDPIEKIGIERSLERIGESELLIAVFDASIPPDEDDERIAALLEGTGSTRIAVLNKTDAGINDQTAALASRVGIPVYVSAKEGDISALTAKIKELYLSGDIKIGEDAIISSARQYAVLSRVREHLGYALSALESGIDQSAAASDLEASLSALCELEGKRASEEILDSVFSHFCVGK